MNIDDRPPPPSRFPIGHIMPEQVELYQHVPFPGQTITVGVHLFPVD